MSTNLQFSKNSLCSILHKSANIYKDYFCDYDYLVISRAFVDHIFYEISSKSRNFLHLTGLYTKMPSNVFFSKCLDGSIKARDFEYYKVGAVPTYKDKLSVILNIRDLFSNPHTLVQENFQRNTISCTIATSEKTFTLGFTRPNVVVPMTLLKGNKLDMSLAKPILLTLRKDRHTRLYDEIVYGDISILRTYYPIIKHRLSERLINLIEN